MSHIPGSADFGLDFMAYWLQAEPPATLAQRSWWRTCESCQPVKKKGIDPVSASINTYKKILVPRAGLCLVIPAQCRDRPVSTVTLGSDRSNRVGAPVSHAFDLYNVPHVFTASLSALNSCPSPPPQPPAQDTCERITLLPALIAPRLSLLFSFSLFSFILWATKINT
jgi:hypothetical protein